MKAHVRYGGAVLATILATLLRMALAPVVGAAAPFATYFLAALLVAWYWGFRAAAVTILLSTAAGTYFFVSPATTSPLYLGTRVDRVTVVGFIIGSLVLTFLLDLQHGTLQRVQREVVRRRVTITRFGVDASTSTRVGFR